MCVICKQLLFLFLTQQVLLCHPAKDKIANEAIKFVPHKKSKIWSWKNRACVHGAGCLFLGHRSEMRNLQHPLTDGL